MSPITEQDSEQNERIKELETKIKTLEEEVDKYQDKEHQALNQRIRLIEKQVWGAGAVIAVLVFGIGIITQMDTVDDDWDDEAKIEHVINIA